jgi:hypothetical protein
MRPGPINVPEEDGPPGVALPSIALPCIALPSAALPCIALPPAGAAEGQRRDARDHEHRVRQRGIEPRKPCWDACGACDVTHPRVRQSERGRGECQYSSDHSELCQ